MLSHKLASGSYYAPAQPVAGPSTAAAYTYPRQAASGVDSNKADLLTGIKVNTGMPYSDDFFVIQLASIHNKMGVLFDVSEGRDERLCALQRDL